MDATAAGIGLSTVTLLVAIATLWLVALDRVERRRRGSRVDWKLSARSREIRTDSDGEEHHALVLRLANNGTGTARITGTGLVDAELVRTNNPMVPSTFPPGAVADFKVEPCDPDGVWMLLMYFDVEDIRETRVIWVTPAATGPLQEEQARQFEALPRSMRARRRQARKAGSVGPGGSLQRLLRRGSKASQADYEEAASLAGQAGSTTIHT